MEKNFVTALKAQNATETTKTEIDVIEVPQGVSKLVEVGAQISSAGCTTLEGISFILEVESANAPWGGAQQFASDSIVPTAPVNACLIPSKVHDCNLPVTAGQKLTFSTTFNTVLTINPSIRCFGKFA